MRQSFTRYRLDVYDCLINAFYVLRDEMLGSLVTRANQQMTLLASSSKAKEATTEALEATLACVSAIHEAVPEDEEVYMAALLSGPFLPYMSGVRADSAGLRLRNTALVLLGE